MKKELVQFIFILIFTFLIHLSYLNNGFVWLDHGDIEGKRAVLPVYQLAKPFVSRFAETNFYRPLVTVFNSLDAYLYQDKAWGFHLTNVLLLLFVVAAVYFFVYVYFELNKRESLFVSLVTAIHPLTILPAGAISYRPELLTVLFTLTTLVFYIKMRISGYKNWLFPVLISYFAALSAKETALFWIPAFILIWELTRGADRKKSDYKNFLLIGAITLFYLFLRRIAVSGIWSVNNADLNFSQAIGTRAMVLLKRLSEAISPLKPSFSDATRIADLNQPVVWLVFIILAFVTVTVIKSGKKSAYTRLILYIFAGLLPALSLVPLPRFSSPHYGLIAVPAAGVIAVLFYRQIKNQSTKQILMFIAGLWFLIMSVSTFRAGFQFKDDYTLFMPEVQNDVNFREGHFYLGDYFLRKGDYESAEKHLLKALNDNPNYIAFVDRNAAMTNLAGAYLAQDKYLQAEKLLEELVKISTGSQKLLALYNLAVIKERRGDYRGIIVLLKDTLNQWSQSQPVLLYLKALVKSGNLPEALEILKNKLNITDKFRQEEIIRTILSRF